MASRSNSFADIKPRLDSLLASLSKGKASSTWQWPITFIFQNEKRDALLDRDITF